MSVYLYLKKFKSKLSGYTASGKVVRKERKTYLTSLRSNSSAFERDILLLVHSLEKGMSLKNVKKGYGEEKAKKLIMLLSGYVDCDVIEKYVLNEGVSMIGTYIKFQKDNNSCDTANRINEQFKLLKDKIQIKSLKTEEDRYPTGYICCKRENDSEVYNYNFNKLVKSRHSIRSTLNKEINEEYIKKAIDMAMYAPSACNRQPCKVYFAKDKNIVQGLRNIVPGNNGFNDEYNNFLVISAKRNYFGGEEMFQWYINGGIFSAYLVLALTSLNIGTCIFQWPAFNKNENELRSIMDIDNDESIICIVGIGICEDEYKCLRAARKDTNDILIIR